MAKHTKNISTNAEGEDDYADATTEEMAEGAAVGANQTPDRDVSHSFKGEQDHARHPDWTTFRTDVENTAAGDLGKIIGPKDPYPTGNPPDPRQEFAHISGTLPGEGDAGGVQKPNPNA